MFYKLKQLHKSFKDWKPIHLCWWFNKYNLPIPPYLIGKVSIPTVTTQACTDKTVISATGNGNITSNGGGTITEKGVCYKVGTTGDPTTADSTAHDHINSTGAYTEAMTGLSPSTNYRVRAYAINSAGTGYGTTVQLSTTPIFNLVSFRFYLDGTESGSNPIAAEGGDLSGADAIATVNQTWTGHLRILVQETAGVSGATTDDWKLIYSRNSAISFTSVTDISTCVKAWAGSLTDGAATTNRSTNGLTDGTGSFVAGACDEVNGVIENVQVTANNFTELLWSIQLVSEDLKNGDTIDFGVNYNAGKILTTDIPRITISKGTAPTADLNTPTDTQDITDTTPALDFTGTDINSDEIDYNIQVDTVDTFNSTTGTVIVDSYDKLSGSLLGLTTTGYTKVGQSFTVDATSILSSCKFKMGKAIEPTGTIVAKLFSHSGTYGSSSVGNTLLATSTTTLDISTLTDVEPTAAPLVTFDFDDYEMAPGYYVIALELVTSGGMGYAWCARDVSASDHDGNSCTFTSPNWTAINTSDLVFYVYGSGPVPMIDKNSIDDAGFANPDDAGDTHPWTSGTNIQYTVQSGLPLDTYYWRVRAIDQLGSNTYGAWSDTYSFTVTTGTSSTPSWRSLTGVGL
jgi:hypothetical protein